MSRNSSQAWPTRVVRHGLSDRWTTTQTTTPIGVVCVSWSYPSLNQASKTGKVCRTGPIDTLPTIWPAADQPTKMPRAKGKAPRRPATRLLPQAGSSRESHHQPGRAAAVLVLCGCSLLAADATETAPTGVCNMSKQLLPADLDPASLTAIIDTREQLAFDLSPMQMESGTLATGDYSIRGLETSIAIERKSLDDLVCCCAVERERFDREIQRLLGYQTRAILIEASWAHLGHHSWRSKVTPAVVQASVLSWTARGIPIVLAGTRLDAQDCCRRILFLAARHRYREIRALVGTADSGAANEFHEQPQTDNAGH